MLLLLLLLLLRPAAALLLLAPLPQAAEILVALKKLGEPLEPKEEKFLQGHKSASLSEFEAVAADHGDTVKNLPSTSS